MPLAVTRRCLHNTPARTASAAFAAASAAAAVSAAVSAASATAAPAASAAATAAASAAANVAARRRTTRRPPLPLLLRRPEGRRLRRACPRLQPYVAGAATTELWRLQPHVAEAAAPCTQAAILSTHTPPPPR
eukprot:scaffold96920_cov43-Phaeocystis_antarctica.AAC.1